MSVRIEGDGAVATVVLARPDRRNAVDGPTAHALAEAFRALDRDERVRAIVFSGDGGHFSAGADLTAFGTEAQNRVDPSGDGPMGPTRLELDKPVIAAIEGYAVAGGLELALWCDLRVAAEDAILGVFCRRFGVPLIDGGTVRLPRLIGLSRALDLILTGREVRAREAEAMGLVNRVVPPGTARAVAEGLARELAALPPTCLRADRRAAHRAFDGSISEAMARELAGGLAALSAEGALGAARFRSGAGRHGGAVEG